MTVYMYVNITFFSYPAKVGGDVGRSSPVVPPPSHDSQFTEEIVSYGCSAVQGFFRSIALSVESSLQDTLRYMYELSHLNVHIASIGIFRL